MLPLLGGLAALLAMCAISETAARSLYAPDWEGQRIFTSEMFGVAGVSLSLLLGWLAMRSATTRVRSSKALGTAAVQRAVACGFVAYFFVRAADLGTSLALMLM